MTRLYPARTRCTAFALISTVACSQHVTPADVADGQADAMRTDVSDAAGDSWVPTDSDATVDASSFGIGYIRAAQGTEGGRPYVLANAAFVPPTQLDPFRREFEYAGCQWFEASEVGATDRVDDLRLVDAVGALSFMYLGAMRPLYEAGDSRERWRTGDMVSFVAPSIGLRFVTTAPTAAVVELPPNGTTIARGSGLHYRITMPERADARAVLSFFATVPSPMGQSIRRRADCTVSAIVAEGDIPWTVFERLGAANVSVEAGAGETYLVNLERYSVQVRFMRNPIARSYVVQVL